MTTIAWYPYDGYNGPGTNNSADVVSLPSPAEIGTTPGISVGLLAAGFVGEPLITGAVEFVTSWAAVGGSVAPDVTMSTYDVWESVNWTVIRSPQYIAIFCEPAHSGILRVQAKIDGVLAEGTLILTLSPVGAGYTDVAWDWEAAAAGLFWTDLVNAKQV